MNKLIVLIMFLSLPVLAHQKAISKLEMRQIQASNQAQGIEPSKPRAGFKLCIGTYGLYGVGSMGNGGTITNREMEYYTGAIFAGFSYAGIRLAVNGEYQSAIQKKDPAEFGNSNITGLSINSGVRLDYVGEGFTLGGIYRLSDQYKFLVSSSNPATDNTFYLASGYSVQFVKRFGSSNWGILLDYTFENLKNDRINETSTQSRTGLGFVWSNF